jgi:hypothetical protein
MLSRELMASALLALSWITAFMIALDALIDARAMLRRLGEWKTRLLNGTVVASELASHEVEQRVKQLDSDEPGLVFFDRKHTSHVAGGAVTVGGEQLEVVGAPGAEVWIDAATKDAAAACSSPTEFDALTKSAQGAGGGLRTVRTSLRAGAPVWLVVENMGEKKGGKLEVSVVSGFDPRPWAKSRLLGIAGLQLLNAGWVAGGTVLALWPPAFGLVSIVGAIVLIGHFLGMTALAMGIREKSRSPAIAFLRGAWERPAADAAAMAPAPR